MRGQMTNENNRLGSDDEEATTMDGGGDRYMPRIEHCTRLR